MLCPVTLFVIDSSITMLSSALVLWHADCWVKGMLFIFSKEALTCLIVLLLQLSQPRLMRG